MKHLILPLIISILFCYSLSKKAFSQDLPTVIIEKEPKTVEEFIDLRNKIAISPQGGAAMFILALKIYSEDVNLGTKFIIISVDKNLLIKGNKYKGYDLGRSSWWTIKNQIKKNKKIPNSYIKGANPENNYTTKLPYRFNFCANPYSGNKTKGDFKVFVKCSGADSNRPMRLKKNTMGIWKVNNWSSILVGIKKSKKKKIIDDL